MNMNDGDLECFNANICPVCKRDFTPGKYPLINLRCHILKSREDDHMMWRHFYYSYTLKGVRKHREKTVEELGAIIDMIKAQKEGRLITTKK